MGRVGAVHVERRVGLGVAEPLGLGEGVGVAHAAVGHRRQDEVAGAVEDALDGRDLVGGQALGQGADDRDAAGDAGLEADRPLVLPGRLEDLRPVLGEQRLVRGDDVLAGRQGIEHDLPGDAGPADQLDDDVDCGSWIAAAMSVEISSFGIVGRGLCRVANDDALEVDGRPARAAMRSGCSSRTAPRRRRRCRRRRGRCSGVRPCHRRSRRSREEIGLV